MEQKYHDLLTQCSPYIVCHPASLDKFNLKYMDQEIEAEHRYNPLALKDKSFIEKLIKLDQLSFGSGGMGMPKWVLFDCALIPGAVIGFGIKSSKLSKEDREKFQVSADEFVPLSMYIAIPNADGESWFGHNLSSLNNILAYKLSGLGLLTKFYALGVMKIKKLIGATQWDSPALGLHLKLSPMKLLASYVPIHTHQNSLCYESSDFYSLDEVFTKRVLTTNDRFQASMENIEKLQVKIESGLEVNLIAKDTKQLLFYLNYSD